MGTAFDANAVSKQAVPAAQLSTVQAGVGERTVTQRKGT